MRKWKKKSQLKDLIKLIEDFSLFIKSMVSYFLNCRKNTTSKNPKVVKIKDGRIMILSKCAVWDTEKLKFIKDQ